MTASVTATDGCGSEPWLESQYMGRSLERVYTAIPNVCYLHYYSDRQLHTVVVVIVIVYRCVEKVQQCYPVQWNWLESHQRQDVPRGLPCQKRVYLLLQQRHGHRHWQATAHRLLLWRFPRGTWWHVYWRRWEAVGGQLRRQASDVLGSQQWRSCEDHYDSWCQGHHYLLLRRPQLRVVVCGQCNQSSHRGGARSLPKLRLSVCSQELGHSWHASSKVQVVKF